jgi:beta-lactamase regulating signal transducer with metallopeptidase domain
MTALIAAALWCIVQVTIVTAAALAVACLLMRRSAPAAAMATASAAATVVAMTLIAPAPLPTFLSSADSEISPEDRTGALSGEATDHTEDIVVDHASGAAASLADVIDAVRRLAAASQVRNRGSEIAAWGAAIFAAGGAAGLLKLGLSLRYVGRVRRRSVAVGCPRAQRLFVELAGRFAIRRPISLRESIELSGPAAVGWRRPAVIVPVAHRLWTDEQLRAALAHELAHVERGDFAWRLAACTARALHFVHPLVHWLTRRLVLAQELAADQLAAAVTGGGRSYLQALSELAIRLDDPSRLRAEPIVLPAFSSHLERRIAMLRSTDGSDEFKRRRRVGVAAAVLVALVGAATTALRGGADSTEPVRVDATEPALFARSKVDLSMLGGSHKGLFVVRVAELFQRPAFAPFVQAIQTSVDSFWPQMFGVEAPRLDLTAIEFVAGVPQLTIGGWRSDDHPEATGRVMFGAGEFVVRFHEAVEIEPWVERYLPETKVKQDGDFTYFELPAMPALGPASMMMTASDDRTLVFAWGVDRLRTVAAGLPDESTPAEAAQWNELEGGLAAFVADDSNIDRELPTPKAPSAQIILKHVNRYGWGFDLDPVANQAGIRIELACADMSSATTAAEAIESLMPQMREEINAQLDAQPMHAADDAESSLTSPLSDAERQYAQFWVRALESCDVRVEPSTSGASVRIVATADFPATLAGMHELATRATDGESERQE